MEPLFLLLLYLTFHTASAGYPMYSADIECYQRVAVGKRLNETDVSNSLIISTVRLCEQECERATCQAFSFGMSAGGNGTCELSNMKPKADPRTDIEYDLFYKNTKCLNKTSCFRRLATGRSLIDRFVKKTIYCDSLRSCEEACAQETSFNCEGFNFKFDRSGYDQSKCQLTSMPGSKLSLTSDFNADREFDFYEKDRNAPRSCFYPYIAYRPWTGYGEGYHPNYIPYDEGRRPPYDGYYEGGPPPPPDDPGHHLIPHRDGYNPNQIHPHNNQYEYGGGQHAFGLGHRWGLPDECFIRTKTGFRLDRNKIVVSLTVPSLYECENECVNERKFACNVFSFRYSVTPSVPGDNCHLGEMTYRSLDSYTDILPDRDYDIYERNLNGREGCQPKRYWGSDCFERVRTGIRLKDSMAKYALKVASLSDCESACIHMPYFTCRAFSFRYGPPLIGERPDNCLLTDWLLPDMNIHKHFIPDPECEIYYRGSYGHGCEIGRNPDFPGGIYDRPEHIPGNHLPEKPVYLPPKRPEYPPEKPYLPPKRPEYPPEKPAYLPPRPEYPIDKPLGGYLPSKPGSGYLPSKPSYVPPKYPVYDRPQGYLPPETGKYLPPKPTGYLPPEKPEYPPKHGSYLPPKGNFYMDKYPYDAYPVDRPHNKYLPPTAHSHYGVKEIYRPRPTNHLCYIRYSTPARLLPGAIKTSLWVPSEEECKEECTRIREKTRFRCATISFRGSHCELSDIEQRDLRPGYDYLQDKEFWMFTWDFGTAGCYYPPPPGRPPLLADHQLFGDRGVETWAHFTVNGQPCKAGTVCTQNPEVGVWTCPIENGDWDYCCRSGHQCGYSEGYNYPCSRHPNRGKTDNWCKVFKSRCYVGSADKDQWRPCSDSYYPYAHSGRKLHWPVAYLHKEGPPNITIEHKPSIVDTFLKNLEKDKPQIKNTTLLEEINLPPEPRTDTSTITSDKSAMDKLWIWGQSKYKNTTETTEMTTVNEVTTTPNMTETTVSA